MGRIIPQKIYVKGIKAMANFNFNRAMLGGRLTSDIELKQTPTGVATCSFSVAV